MVHRLQTTQLVVQLMEAVCATNMEQVRKVLQVRPELVNASDPSIHGHTALHHAVLGQMPEMVRVLMQLGANPYTSIYPHGDATSPLMIAVERGYNEIAAIIREEENRRQAGRPTAAEAPAGLRQALQAGDEDRAIEILEHHPELVHFQMPGDRRTLLHFASALLLSRVATWLLDHSADVNQESSDGSTSLELAGRMCSSAKRKRGSPHHGKAAARPGSITFGALLRDSGRCNPAAGVALGS